MRRAQRSVFAEESFQSTPTNTGGRCHTGWPPGPGLPCFNPRPPILAGDARQAGGLGLEVGVSIHAHQYWRAMHSKWAPGIFADGVSIHAHQYWRAMRPCGHAAWTPRNDALFQSTPTNTGGRCDPADLRKMFEDQFQSTPTNTGGRCVADPGQGLLQRSFNPRPPILAGDAARHPGARRATVGFNPRPPILAGDAGKDYAKAIEQWVSIHAHQYWRAMPRRSAVQQPRGCFNPRPPILAGDAGANQRPGLLG